jgi:hypothetical protein
METINIMDNNQKKEMVEKKLHKHGMRDFKIRYNFNYYDIDRTPEPVRTVPEDNKDSTCPSGKPA